MENEWILWSLFIPYSPSPSPPPPVHHPHPSHHHCSSELRKLPHGCPCSHLAHLQPVPCTGFRVNLRQSLIQIKHSSQKPPMASQRIKSQILSRIFIDFLWPDLVADCCPGFLLWAPRGPCHSSWLIETLLLQSFCTGCSFCLDAIPWGVGKAHSSTSGRSLLELPLIRETIPDIQRLYSLFLCSASPSYHLLEFRINYNCLHMYLLTISPLSQT